VCIPATRPRSDWQLEAARMCVCLCVCVCVLGVCVLCVFLCVFVFEYQPLALVLIGGWKPLVEHEIAPVGLFRNLLQCVAVFCSVLHCVCSVLQRDAVCCRVFRQHM